MRNEAAKRGLCLYVHPAPKLSLIPIYSVRAHPTTPQEGVRKGERPAIKPSCLLGDVHEHDPLGIRPQLLHLTPQFFAARIGLVHRVCHEYSFFRCANVAGGDVVAVLVLNHLYALTDNRIEPSLAVTYCNRL
jgi:hypothetical protein